MDRSFFKMIFLSRSTLSSVPLGTPLMDTVVEVRDEQGCIVTDGEGQVFIGEADLIYKDTQLH